MKNKNQDPLIVLIIAIIFLIVLGPLIFFWTGYFYGWIATKFIGKYIIEFLTMFNLDIPLEKIPLITGILNFIINLFIPIKTKN